MPITRPIPTEAQLLADALRADVPKPIMRAEDVVGQGGNAKLVRVTSGPLRTTSTESILGRHPKSQSMQPTYAARLPIPGNTDAIMKSFLDWWNEQTDPLAAMDAIWGDEPRVQDRNKYFDTHLPSWHMGARVASVAASGRPAWTFKLVLEGTKDPAYIGTVGGERAARLEAVLAGRVVGKALAEVLVIVEEWAKAEEKAEQAKAPPAP